MKLLNGDKDTFRFAWLATKTPFVQMPHRVTPLGLLREDQSFCGHSMMQYGFDGSPLFFHHNQAKRAQDLPMLPTTHVKRVITGYDDEVHAVIGETLIWQSRYVACYTLEGVRKHGDVIVLQLS